MCSNALHFKNLTFIFCTVLFQNIVFYNNSFIISVHIHVNYANVIAFIVLYYVIIVVNYSTNVFKFKCLCDFYIYCKTFNPSKHLEQYIPFIIIHTVRIYTYTCM